MNQTWAAWLLIGIALVTANLPFLTERAFGLFRWRRRAEAMDAGSHAASTTTAVAPSVEAGTAIPLPPSDDGSPR